MATSTIPNNNLCYLIDTQTLSQIYNKVYADGYTFIATTANGTKTLTSNDASFIGSGYAIQNQGYVQFELFANGNGRMYFGRINNQGTLEYLHKIQGS